MPNPIILADPVIPPKPSLSVAEATDEQIAQLILLVAQSGIIQLPQGKTWDQATSFSFSRQKPTESRAAYWKIGSIFSP